MSNTNPLFALLQSRKFLLLVGDTLVSMILFFGAKYFASNMDDIKFLIGALQPVVLVIIYGISKEDAAAKAVGLFKHTEK